jgi:hypothetical protein
MIANLLLTFALAQSGGAAVFVGSPGSAGNVAVADMTGVLQPHFPPQLQGIALLDIDFNGHTEILRFLPGQPRRMSEGGITWIVLPDKGGALYRFSRAESGGGLTFGLMWIDPTGDAHSVFELPGTGSGGDIEPFEARIAVAPAGDSALVATTLAAGGDLYELSFNGAVAQNRTAGLAPLDFGNAGLALSSSLGAAACTDRFLRFDRSVLGDAQAVPFGANATPAWFAGELALSASGLFAVSVAGIDPLQADVWVFASTGDAVKATETPMHVSGAGYLPEATHGPFLAVSDDGTRVAWATEGATREAFMAIVPQAGAASPALHVSADENYLDTLDEIGQFMFRLVSHTLVIAVGESVVDGGGAGIENLDYYEIEMPTQSASNLLNLTASNGLASPPFHAKSSLTPSGTAVLPTGEIVFHSESSGGLGEVLSAAPGQSGLTVHLPNAKDLDELELVGDHLFCVIRSSIGTNARELWTFPATLAGPPSSVLSMPDTQFLRAVTPRSDGLVAFVQTLNAKERLWALDTGTGVLRKARRFMYGPTLAFTPTGEVAFSVGSAGTPAVQGAMPFVGPLFRLKGVPVAPGFVLHGAGF